MKGRRFVWSDPHVMELARSFVPVADEVYRLQTGSDAECRLFQKIAEQGHYKGRVHPTSTRQGTYAAAPSGVLLASINSHDPERMADMLRRALVSWKILLRKVRLLPEDPEGLAADVKRKEQFYPTGGLVLRVNSRDLPRELLDDSEWTARAWNQDYAWFTKEEARQLLPVNPKTGVRHEVPQPMIRRIARCHLVDNVCGQTRPWAEEEVEQARLTAEIDSVDRGVVSLRLQGETRAAAEGVWSVRGIRDMNSPTPQRRGFEAHLLGRATYDLDQERFLAFEMISLGTRWGATQYNVRADDPGPALMGVAFSLAGDSLAEQVAPAFLSA